MLDMYWFVFSTIAPYFKVGMRRTGDEALGVLDASLQLTFVLRIFQLNKLLMMLVSRFKLLLIAMLYRSYWCSKQKKKPCATMSLPSYRDPYCS